MKARPHINGNTKADFERAYNELTKAFVAASNALKALRMDVVHGRNYQHLPAAEARAALEEDMRSVQEIAQFMKRIERLQASMLPAITH